MSENAPNLDVRAKLRKEVFSSKYAGKREQVTYHGVELEVRQPSLSMVLGGVDDIPGNQMLLMIIACCFIPDTNDPLFEVEDMDVLKSQVYDDDFQNLTKTLNGMIGMDLEAHKAAKGEFDGTH